MRKVTKQEVQDLYLPLEELVIDLEATKQEATKQEVQDKADRCLDLYLPLEKIVIDLKVPLWENTCDNARALYPRRGNLRIAQLDILPRE